MLCENLHTGNESCRERVIFYVHLVSQCFLPDASKPKPINLPKNKQQTAAFAAITSPAAANKPIVMHLL